MIRPPPISPLFPYTTLFRSCRASRRRSSRRKICSRRAAGSAGRVQGMRIGVLALQGDFARHAAALRSEEHTSELQSQSNLVCRLLLEKKKYRHHVVVYELTH